MGYKRILSIQDISCIGQCSLTVALPILSACGHETAILPSAVLSTHTGGFKGYTFRDLTDDIPMIANHWEKENLRFEAVYTGYLGSAAQINMAKDIFNRLLVPGAKKIVDPAMGDNGRLYYGFDDAFVLEMKKLVAEADIAIPNITEAALLTGSEYKEEYDEAYIDDLLKKLHAIGAKTIIFTGVSYDENTTGVVVSTETEKKYYKHSKIARRCHGTGDVFASAFVGAYLNGKSEYEAATIAADFTVKAIENTLDDESHWYGVKFETVLKDLINKLN